MATGNTLIFNGIAWPAVRIVNSSLMIFKTYPDISDSDYKPPSRPIFTLAASGRGRRWSATHPQGFWRDFTELDPADAEAVMAFVRRRGDPDGLLDASTEHHTGYWYMLFSVLSAAVHGWEPEDAAGISHLTTTDPGRLRYANSFVRDFGHVAKDLEPVLDPAGPGFAFRARTLAAFMVASAASALERGVAFRRCDHCRSWFEFVRKDARFCSGSCRAFHSRQKEKP
jgi:hypothetical protein